MKRKRCKLVFRILWLILMIAAFLSQPVMAQQTQTKDKVTMEEITVKDTREVEKKQAKTGSAEDGYRVDTASFGPLGEKSILDTPYQINVVSEEMMEHLQIKTLKEVTKYLPSAQIEERGGADVGRPQTRGFEGTVSENNRMDGMNIAVTTAYPMEQFERIEILNGLTGSLYGPANPSGVFNFILKRPTATPFFRANLGYNTKENAVVHADIGGPIGKKFGYRLNLLHSDGEGSTDASTVRRKLISAAFDWYMLANTVAELNFSYYDFIKKGYPASFSYGANIQLPDAFDATQEGYGQDWAGHHLTTRTTSLRIKHDFNQDWRLTAGILDQKANRDMFTLTNTFTNNSGNYRTTFRPSSSAWEVDSEMLYLNGRAKTGSISHDLTLGTNGHERRMMRNRNDMTSTITVGTASIANPVRYDEPSWYHGAGGDRYKGSILRQQALIAGDTVTFNKYLSAMLSASYSWLYVRNYNADGNETSRYNDDGLSPMASLMYKPLENITAYIMYADSLQQGDTAPTTAANPGETLPPYRSDQWEAGLKVALKKINLSGAVFRIERPFAYTGADNVFKKQGNQVNYGLELTASGKIMDSVTVYAGVTFLDPKLKDTGKATTTDKQVVGVPKEQANLLIEYTMPFVNGLTPFVNLHYTGKRAANDTNTSWASAYTTIDLGAQYVAKIMGVDTTWRLAVNNLTDEAYWSSIFPGSINGTGASSSAFPGAPREIMASVEIAFK